jgi:hypothetical protein
MFKWLRGRGAKKQQQAVAEAPPAERDSGEEEYESAEEVESEIAPSGMTRAKTDNI